MIYNIIAILISLILPIIIFKNNGSIKKIGLKNWAIENKYKLLIYTILVIGMLIRTVEIANIPYGIGGDEASEGYEAYSLLHYGVDRHLKSFPVHFISWGSGQNSLYAYLDIPFIAILGLNEFAVRIPMAILGCITLLLIYLFFSKYTGKKTTLIALICFTISPWHIMKSRWSLESNLFPDLILISTILLYVGIKESKNKAWLAGLIIMGISVYSYGTAYFFIPFYLLILLVGLLIKRKISIKKAILSFLLVGMIGFPLVMFIAINNFDLPEVKLGIITIPRLTANRYQEISSVFSGDFIQQSLNNFGKSIKMIVTENDDILSNRIEKFGIFYKTGYVFALIGLIKVVVDAKKKENRLLNFFFTAWIITGTLLMFVCDPNINRLNIFMIPFLYYIILGINLITEKIKIIKYPFLIGYIILFVLFSLTYFGFINKQPVYFEHDVRDMIAYVNSLGDKTVYIYSNRIDEYIYFLFYTKENTIEFNKTVEYGTKGKNWEKVNSYKNFMFYIPDKLENRKNNVYVLPEILTTDVDKGKWDIKYFKRFIVLEGKE